MKLRLTFAVAGALSLAHLTGCSTTHQSRASSAVADALATAGGAALGYVLSDGNTAATLGGAAAGLVAKRYADGVRDKEEQKKLQTAYDTAHAQATRELYDATQRLQAISTATPAAAEEPEPVYLPTQIPERKINGVIIEPSTEYIRITDNASK